MHLLAVEYICFLVFIYNLLLISWFSTFHAKLYSFFHWIHTLAQYQIRDITLEVLFPFPLFHLIDTIVV